jgi:GAF domain-containing protein
MDGRGDGHRRDAGPERWSQAFPQLARAGLSDKLRSLLEQAEAAHLESAALLRALGREDRAQRVEQFAAWTRLELDEPELIQRLHAVTKNLRDVSRLGSLLDRALDGALSLLRADRGNVQIVDPVTRSLRIACSRGFGAEFLDYFAVVADDSSACGRAAAQRIQTVIADVNIDPRFAPHREIAAASGFRAVQSTPLSDGSGRVLGVVSIHYPHPYRPPDRDLLLMRRFGQKIGEAMAHHMGAFPHGPAGDPLGWSVASRFGRLLLREPSP